MRRENILAELVAYTLYVQSGSWRPEGSEFEPGIVYIVKFYLSDDSGLVAGGK